MVYVFCEATLQKFRNYLNHTSFGSYNEEHIFLDDYLDNDNLSNNL